MSFPSLAPSVLATSTTTGTGTLTLGSPVTGYQAIPTAFNGLTVAYAIEGVDGNGTPTGEWEDGMGVYASAGPTLTRVSAAVEGSSNANALVSLSAGTKRVTITPLANWFNALFGIAPGIWVSGTSGGGPDTVADESNITTLYAEPVNGGVIPVFLDAAGTQPYFALLAATTLSKALGTLTASIGYDLFIDYGVTSAGALSLTLVAWTSANARATAIDRVNGRWYKHGDYRFLLVYSFYTSSTTQTQNNSGGSTTQVGGKRFGKNIYNRVPKSASVIDTADTWAYASTTWQVANGATAPLNCIEYFDPLGDIYIEARLQGNCYLANAAHSAYLGIGVNATNAVSGRVGSSYLSTGNMSVVIGAGFTGYGQLGYNKICWLNRTDGTSETFIGDNGETAGVQSGLGVTMSA